MKPFNSKSYCSIIGAVALLVLGGSQSIYGQYENARELLLERKTVPAEMQGMVDVLNRYAPIAKK